MYQAMKAAKTDMQAAGITMSPVSAEEMAWISELCQ